MLTLSVVGILFIVYEIYNGQADQTWSVTNSSHLAPIAPMGQDGDWKLIFNDEFEDTSLDIDKWTTCYWWDRDGCNIASNNELEWYQSQNVLVGNGTLRLQAKEHTITASDGNTYNYTSGIITSGRVSSDTTLPSKFVFQYGYAEIRAKIPSGPGLWPAFWMLPDTHNSKPEIDVMEILGHEPNTIHMHVHYLNYDGSSDNSGRSWTGPDFSAGWHTFAVDWQPDAITWYVDGIARWRYTDSSHIPAQPMYLLINLAVGGDWPGAPDSSTQFPSEYEIDYVRVWSKDEYVIFDPIADAFVKRSSPTMNFGSLDTLYGDGTPVKVSYIKFDTTSFRGKSIASARLRIRTTSDPDAGSSNSQTVKLINDSIWNENTLTYDNKPTISSETILGNIANTLPNMTYDIPLDTSLLQPKIGGTFTLVLDSTGDDGIYFYSKESGLDYPQLIITVPHNRVQLPQLLK